MEFLGNSVVNLFQGDLGEFVRLGHASLVSNCPTGMISLCKLGVCRKARLCSLGPILKKTHGGGEVVEESGGCEEWKRM